MNKSNLFYNNYFNIINENYHNLLNNNFHSNNIYHKNLIKNKSIENFSINTLYNNTQINSSNNLTSKENCNKNINPNEPFEMHKIFKNSINHILYAKPFFIKINNEKLLKEIEFNYIKNELNKKGINIYNLLEGCLDSIKNLDNDN